MGLKFENIMKTFEREKILDDFLTIEYNCNK